MNIFCSGIGGIGLSAYAAYRKAEGHRVSGSDRAESALIADLRSQGITVTLNQGGSAVPEDADLFVYTLALPEDHPERVRARTLGIPCRTYFEALGDLLRESGKKVIAVCGTHGKSSTTAMAAKTLIDAGLDPSVILGTKTKDLGGRNWRKGDGNLFLVEACEYRRSFLNLDPDIILMTNCTGDHFDAFRDMEDYRQAFGEFIGRLPAGGVLVTHEHVYDMCRNYLQNVHDIRIRYTSPLPAPPLRVPGAHMRENARLVLALADVLGIPHAAESLKTYRGCWRRAEKKAELRMENGEWRIAEDGVEGNVVIIDDYGHHPNEIRATLEGLKETYPGRRLVCVFQPHTHDRVLKLYDDFLTAFRSAGVVVIPNVYDARPQRDSERVDVGRLIADIARGSSADVVDGRSLEETAALLQRSILRPNDLLVTMGAGDVWKVGEALLQRAPTSPSPSAR